MVCDGLREKKKEGPSKSHHSLHHPPSPPPTPHSTRHGEKDDGADAAPQGLAKAAGLLAGCEWRFSEVTAVEPVSPDGSVRRVRLEPLPGLPSLVPDHISARQPGTYVCMDGCA